MSMVSRVSGSFTIPQIIGYSILHCSNGGEVPQVNAGVNRYFDEGLITEQSGNRLAEILDL